MTLFHGLILPTKTLSNTVTSPPWSITYTLRPCTPITVTQCTPFRIANTTQPALSLAKAQFQSLTWSDFSPSFLQCWTKSVAMQPPHSQDLPTVCATLPLQSPCSSHWARCSATPPQLWSAVTTRPFWINPMHWQVLGGHEHRKSEALLPSCCEKWFHCMPDPQDDLGGQEFSEQCLKFDLPRRVLQKQQWEQKWTEELKWWYISTLHWIFALQRRHISHHLLFQHRQMSGSVHRSSLLRCNWW